MTSACHSFRFRVLFAPLCVFLVNFAVAEPSVVATTAITPDDPMLPDGYMLVAHLNCGEETKSPKGEGPQLRLLHGESYRFPEAPGPLGSVTFDGAQVEVAAEGLDPAADYVLGFTWWDADNRGRVQSVAFTQDDGWETVLPPERAVAFHADEPTWARVLLPVPKDYREGGALRAVFKKHEGPNVVVSEVWLLERTQPDDRKQVLIVTGDDYAGHRWRETAPEFAEMLREAPRLAVSICESPAIYGSPLIEHYDATLFHFKNYDDRLPLSDAVRDGLRDYVANGGGVVIAHFGCGAFQEWDGFVDVAGRVWDPGLRGHDPYGKFTVRVTDDDHPITRGFDDFTVEDELYTCLAGDAPIRVLCEATSKVDEKDYPMGFVVENTGGRVFHCLLGHDVNALQSEGGRELYRRAMAWAARLE